MNQPRPQGFSLKKWVGREKVVLRWQKSKGQYFRVCAIQKLKIHLIVHYSNAISLWKGVPALRCHVQNISNASELRQAVID